MSASPPDAAAPHEPRVRVPLAAVAIVCLMGIAFFWTCRWMVVRWEHANSYYSHGWLIVPISAFLLYLKRKRIASCPRRPCGWGMLIVVPCLMLHLVATAWRVGFVSGFALLGVVAGLVLVLHGSQMLRLTLFPIVFLLFMVPLPAVLIEKISFNLKLMAAGAAAGILEVLGLAAVREGSYIYTPRGPVVVDDVCSGLKYLISLTAFGALYAYISSLRGWMKGLLFALAIPVSFVANIVRVTLLVLIGYKWGVSATQKWYSHDVLGFALFAVAFMMLFLTESLLLGALRRVRGGPASTPAEEPPTEEDAAPAPASAAAGVPRASRVLPTGVFSVLLVVALLSTYLSWPKGATDPTATLAAIPSDLGPWGGVDVMMDERVYEILGTRDLLARVYRNDRQRGVQLVIVLAEKIRKRTHPPEQCITGEGYAIVGRSERDEPLVFADPDGPLRVHELLLEGRDGRHVLWYFYKSGPHLNTSYWRHQAGVAFRKFRDPNASDILVRLDVGVSDNDLEDARQLLRDFLSHAMDPIMKDLP